MLRFGRGLVGRAASRPLAVLSRRIPLRELVIAPQDIRTADPTRADDIYAGYFVFGGRLVKGDGRTPFDIAAPTPEFARDLAGFSWLRHLRAAGTALALTNARALVRDFIAAESRLRAGVAGEPAVLARRILSWLSQSAFVLKESDADFYRAFLRCLSHDAVLLGRRYGATVGPDRLLAGIALTELALCADLGAGALKRASGALAEEIGRQIFADGGHVGRNPETLIELLLDLLPLRQAFAARNQPVPQPLLNAIDRMIPMLRLLRHGDGSLALFNGMGVTEPDHLATVLAYADSRGRALLNGPHAGYQRMEGADAVVIVDAGAPPPPALSLNAHAGCLSFEFSIGRERLVINCGAASPGKPEARAAGRQTAAHSTLTLDNTSSCRFAVPRSAAWQRGSAIVAGPREVQAERREQTGATTLDLSHDGYGRMFGLRHQRRLALTRDGQRLVGEDSLAAVAGTAERAAARADIRFHLHPAVRVDAGPTEGTLHLVTPGGAIVVFEAGGHALAVEESVLFAASSGTQRSRQIVVSVPAQQGVSVTWSFTRRDRVPPDAI